MDSYGYGLNIAREATYPTPFVNGSWFLPLLLSLMKQPHTPRTRNAFRSEYDYIIVGGGTAGSALASRLSEEDCVTVLLLEAGAHAPLMSEVGPFSKGLWNSDVDWAYKTVPQKNTGFGLEGNKLPFPSGKVLGGTSVMNGMLYVRGNRKNFEDWVDLGAEGWSYEDVLPYFKKAEDNEDPAYVASGYHGKDGPVSVSWPKYTSSLKLPTYLATQELGYKIIDSNGDRQTGFYDPQVTARHGVRCSAAKAYLVSVENRTNLDIVLKAHVRKIEIKGNPVIATGVTFDHSGHTYTVNARREVIVSAGTVNTAQILMLSGVGPKNELRKHKIPLLVDVPVGSNFMDHPSTFINFLIDPSVPTFLQKLSSSESIREFIESRSGPMTSVAAISYIAFLRDSEIDPPQDIPNYQLYLREDESIVYKDSFGFTNELYNAFFKPDENKPQFDCNVQLLQPKSRGTVTLNSSDPYDPPLIDPNYYEHPQDVQDMVEGLKQCILISKTVGFQKLGARLPEQLFPGCEDFCKDDDQYLRCIVKHAVVTKSHQVGTARIGHPNDPNAVVDSQLKVRGICNLRVVDASVMPIVTSGNTMTPVYMIAEKAADMIKADLYKQSEVHSVL